MNKTKYRAWDRVNNRMILPNKYSSAGWKIDFLGNIDYKGTWSTQDIILMQYADLNDKNGNEIYEGDLVEKNPDTWKPNDFDSWGRGEGAGEVLEVLDKDLVDVRWKGGRCYEFINQLIKIKDE